MADVIIGGVTYSVSLPNFKAIKAVWPFISAAQDSPDPLAGIDAALAIVVKASGQDVTVDQLEEALTPDEIPGMGPFVVALAGEISPKGEAEAPKDEASPSTETSNESSSTSVEA